MKTIFLPIFLSFFLIPAVAKASVSITEIAWMGTTGENGQFGEWIELYNSGEDMSLSGWKLYSDGGDTLLFSLSKTIPAGGYFLIERTTASMSDPVPGVDDESGSFGGGGLSNEGEHLVLKDSSGAVVQDLDYSAGWPAGDSASKKTMQKNGSGWSTALATPKASYDGEEDGQEEQETDGGDNSSDASSKSKKSNSSPKEKYAPHLTLAVPSALYQYVDYTFSAELVLEDGKKHISGPIEWNFGDGTMVKQKNLAPITHRYRHPGTYTVWVGWYDTVFDTEPTLSAMKIIKVGSPSLTLTVTDEGKAIELTNESDIGVDLSSWQIVAAGHTAALPLHTVLSPKASITIEGSTLGLDSLVGAAIARPYGEILLAAAPGNSSMATSKRGTVLSETAVVVPAEASVPATDLFVQQTTSEESGAMQNRTKKVIFGAVALVLLALFVLLQRTMAKGE